MSIPACDDEIFERGTAIMSLHGPRAALIEEWVKQVATATKTRTDWHFAAGHAFVRVLGDEDDIAKVRAEVDRTWHEFVAQHLASGPDIWTVQMEVKMNLLRRDYR